MRLILDACTLIYLTKANLFQEFMNLSSNDVVIDDKVFNEVIVKGKENNYPDASIAEQFLTENHIPTISTNIRPYINYFRDPGETSCFILAKESGTCLTTDKRAFNKFESNEVSVMRLDTYFLREGRKNKYSTKRISTILKKLLTVNATTPERYSNIIEFMLKEGNKK